MHTNNSENGSDKTKQSWRVRMANSEGPFHNKSYAPKLKPKAPYGKKHLPELPRNGELYGERILARMERYKNSGHSI
ncbi:MAG: hypothetical protein MK137_00460 [Rickettsiales bacterium]|nr:hypothetical protein [Rickettsiales bacterium]